MSYKRTNFDQPSDDIDGDDKYFEQGKRFLAARGDIWILWGTDALVRKFRLFHEKEANGVDAGTDARQEVEDENDEECFDANMLLPKSSNQAIKKNW